MPLVSENSPADPTLALAPPSSWRPLRTLLPALITYIVSVFIGGGLLLLTFIIGGKSPVCSELAILLCVGLGGIFSATATLVVATMLGMRILRRAHVERAWMILLMTYVVSILLSSGLSQSLSMLKLGSVGLMAVLILAGIVLFLVSCMFSDWYLNVLRGPAWIKVLLVGIAATVGMMAIGGGGGLANNIATQTRTSGLRSALASSGMTLLIPPPNSTYPQPYTIAAQSNAIAQADYRVGAYFGIDTGAQNGTTLYEYKVNQDLDPIAGCAKISSMLVTESDGQTTCQLAATLPSGTKIYGPAGGYVHQFFIIKNGTAVIYAPPSNMTDENAYDFLDHLVPLEVDSFLHTLHQKNPMEY